MPFDLDAFLESRNSLLSSTQWENYLARRCGPARPVWLEDVGLDPAKVLGEGDFKRYIYEKNLKPRS